jgi:hypothetical protein
MATALAQGAATLDAAPSAPQPKALLGIVRHPGVITELKYSFAPEDVWTGALGGRDLGVFSGTALSLNTETMRTTADGAAVAVLRYPSLVPGVGETVQGVYRAPRGYAAPLFITAMRGGEIQLADGRGRPLAFSVVAARFRPG